MVQKTIESPKKAVTVKPEVVPPWALAIAAAREAAGFKNQTALADKLRVKQQTVSDWERGLRFPRVNHWPALFEHLRLDRHQMVSLAFGLEEIYILEDAREVFARLYRSMARAILDESRETPLELSVEALAFAVHVEHSTALRLCVAKPRAEWPAILSRLAEEVLEKLSPSPIEGRRDELRPRRSIERT